MRMFRTSMTTMRALIGAVIAVTLSLATLGAAAAPASAATNLSYFLTAGTVPITSGGHTWSLNVSLIGGSSGGPTIVDVLIETPHLSGTEIHDWGMQMPGADFTVNKTTGAATINSHSDLSPVASLNLSYKPTSHTAGTCSSGSETDYLGTLTGSVTLTTGPGRHDLHPDVHGLRRGVVEEQHTVRGQNDLDRNAQGGHHGLWRICQHYAEEVIAPL